MLAAADEIFQEGNAQGMILLQQWFTRLLEADNWLLEERKRQSLLEA